MVIFLFLAQYVRKEVAIGFLVPAAGSARVYVPQPGTISQVFVRQGDAVLAAIDGIPLQTLDVREYREQIGAVMQEDQLLSGSIAENISFFDPHFDNNRVMCCARMAGVHAEIVAMPMGYASLIGDMGSSLSGGQKQRVLLARALYKQPKILFLDEGTAHLDIAKEKEINERRRQLDITRISVAHRPDMMAGADTVLRIGEVPA